MELGAMANPLHEQLGINADLVETEQKAINALNYLRIRKFIPAGEVEKVEKRIIKSLERKMRGDPLTPQPNR